jgi:phage gp36-like protein
MNYVTADKMIQLFEEQELIEATNLRDATATQINLNRLQSAIDGATGIINGWLMRRYKLPLTNVPPHLNQTLEIHAANLARNLLDGSTEEVRKKADDAFAWLKEFTKEDVLGDTTPGITEAEKSGSINFEVSQPTWNNDRLAGLF